MSQRRSRWAAVRRFRMGLARRIAGARLPETEIDDAIAAISDAIKDLCGQRARGGSWLEIPAVSDAIKDLRYQQGRERWSESDYAMGNLKKRPALPGRFVLL